jgi:hypothetical protein
VIPGPGSVELRGLEPLTPTLPAARSKVFESFVRCGNPYYIRGFSLRMNLSEHSETTPNLANGYQDGYQMIMSEEARSSVMTGSRKLDSQLTFPLIRNPILDHCARL